jgi:hypothetical protein
LLRAKKIFGGSELWDIIESWVDQEMPQGRWKVELYLGDGEKSENREKEGGHFGRGI